MENANSKEYLEKIKIQVIENLKKTAHAPSVQLTDVPRATLMGDLSDYEDELDDLDEDSHPDERETIRTLDKRIARDDELDESDGEEERLNGARSQNGANKRKNIMDYQNPNAAVPDIEVDSRISTPLQNNDDKVAEPSIEANEDVNDTVMEEKSQSVTGAEAGEDEQSNAQSRSDSAKLVIDNDGDVDMEQVAPEPAPQVLTPAPEGQSPAAVTAPTSIPTTTAATPVSQDPIDAKQEGEAERQDEEVTGEVEMELAQQSES
jgi:histone deacetylase 1/2